MRRAIGPLAGFVAGGVVGLGALLAVGASRGAPRSYPRYSVSITQGAFAVTDNDREEVFLYETSGEPGRVTPLRLNCVIDLTKAGQPELGPKGGADRR